MVAVLLLSDVIGSDVRTVDDVVVGHVVDLAVELDAARPSVARVAIGRRHRIRAYGDWAAVESFEHAVVQLAVSADDSSLRSGADALREREVLLARDVLDTQIVDLAGKRLTRVSDVVLTRAGEDIVVVAAEVGAAGVWRRLGLDRLAERTPGRLVPWGDLHLTSARGHALQLSTSCGGVRRLVPTELAAVVAHLPTGQAAEVLDAVPVESAAHALSASRPSVGARLLHALSASKAGQLMEHMPVDDAATLLRVLGSERAEDLLGAVMTERASTLRRLLAHPVGTAGGLMNADVRTVLVGEPMEVVRAVVTRDPPELAGLATVIVVDDEGRPQGSYEPVDLLVGRTSPRQVPIVASTLPVEAVIDLFALHDVLAVPVVDGDGRVVGVIAVDDVLEELLAERLPGHARFRSIRRRARAHWR